MFFVCVSTTACLSTDTISVPIHFSVIYIVNNNFLTHLDIYVTEIMILIDYGNNEIPMTQAVFYLGAQNIRQLSIRPRLFGRSQ